MSADTSIALAKFKDGYKHTGVIQCIENMERRWFKTEQEYQEGILEYSWSKPFKTKDDCLVSAFHLQERYKDEDDFGLPVEYGVVDIGEFNF